MKDMNIQLDVLGLKLSNSLIRQIKKIKTMKYENEKIFDFFNNLNITFNMH